MDAVLTTSFNDQGQMIYCHWQMQHCINYAIDFIQISGEVFLEVRHVHDR